MTKHKKHKAQSSRFFKKFLALTFLFIISASFCHFSWAQEEIAMPAYRGYVNDFANVITRDDKEAIERLAQELDRKTTSQIAVVTLPTTKPLTIEQYAVGLFEKWGIGIKSKDNGALLLVAVNDRKVRIETGYGLEGAIPDAIANQIIYQIIIPQFKQGRLSKGLLVGVVAISQLVAKEYNVELSGIKAYKQDIKDIMPTSYPLLLLRFIGILFLFIFLYGLRSGPRRRRTWFGRGYGGFGGGGFGGGFGGFGGGMSGGGGASGGW